MWPPRRDMSEERPSQQEGLQNLILDNGFHPGLEPVKPLSQKQRSTFLPLQEAATLILSVDWGLNDGFRRYLCSPQTAECKRQRLLR